MCGIHIAHAVCFGPVLSLQQREKKWREEEVLLIRDGKEEKKKKEWNLLFVPFVDV